MLDWRSVQFFLRRKNSIMVPAAKTFMFRRERLKQHRLTASNCAMVSGLWEEVGVVACVEQITDTIIDKEPILRFAAK